ncbi:MAG TPA: hypothetical protein VJU18_02750 [Vicinamibacteria bacterium]|nr:hypothetical protein [Vicinamibacteria bacterium]
MASARAARTTFVSLALALSVSPALAEQRDRARMLGEIKGLSEQLDRKMREFVEPDASDRAAHAAFLAQPQTGIVRLLPREALDGHPALRDGGAYYSFSNLTHEYGSGSDLELSRGTFSVGFGGADYGVLTVLPDVRLESATVDHPAVRYLDSLETPNVEAEARATARKFRRDAVEDKHTFARTAAARVGSTYALRSVNYGRSDVLVVFQVTREDTDGSMVILWKRLQTYPVPRLVREPPPEDVE